MMELRTGKEMEGDQAGLKRVLVKFSGGIREPQYVLVGPGTTAGELLEHLGQEEDEFILSKGTADSVFGGDEVIYPSLEDGDLVFATSRIDAGF